MLRLTLCLMMACCVSACIESPAGSAGTPEAPSPADEMPPVEAAPPVETPDDPVDVAEPTPVHWLTRCFGLTPDHARVSLTGAQESVQPIPDGEGIVRTREWAGWQLITFEVRFEGVHAFDGWGQDLMLLNSDCSVTRGVDPGNRVSRVELDPEVGQTLYMLTRPSDQPWDLQTGVIVWQPLARPVADPAADMDRLVVADAFVHSNRGYEVRFDLEWRKSPGQSTFVEIWDGETLVTQIVRYPTSADGYAWWTEQYIKPNRAAEQTFRVVLYGGAASAPLDERIVEPQPVAWVEPGAECDPDRVRTLCSGRTDCVGRICQR